MPLIVDEVRGSRPRQVGALGSQLLVDPNQIAFAIDELLDDLIVMRLGLLRPTQFRHLGRPEGNAP